MSAKRKQPAPPANVPSPISAMVARMLHLSERDDRLELTDHALAGLSVPYDSQHLREWRDALMDEYAALETALLHCEAETVGDALALLLFAVSKARDLGPSLSPPVDPAAAARHWRELEGEAALVAGAMEAAMRALLRHHGDELPPGLLDFAGGYARGELRHGPALAELLPAAELRAVRDKLRKGGAA